jgi:hypothetical protein
MKKVQCEECQKKVDHVSDYEYYDEMADGYVHIQICAKCQEKRNAENIEQILAKMKAYAK